MESPYQNRSITLNGASQTVFDAETAADGIDRFIHNQPGNDTVWVNIFGGPAAEHGDGCIGVPAGGLLEIDSLHQINAFGTSGQKIAAGER